MIDNQKIKGLAISQIIVLIVSIVAISYLVGSSFEVVSAQTGDKLCVYTEDGKVWKLEEAGKFKDDSRITCISGGSLETLTISDKQDGFCVRYPEYCKNSATEIISGLFRTCPSEETTVQAPVTNIPTNLNQILSRIGLYPGEPGTASEAEEAGEEEEEEIPGVKGFVIDIVGETGWVIVQNLKWATGLYIGSRILLSQLGVDRSDAKPISLSIAGGYYAAATAKDLGISEAIAGALKISSGLATFGIALITAALLFALTWKDKKIEVYSFTCNVWDAPLGGKKCQDCNKGDLPCTEYRCRSLGQACELINKGTENELCVHISRGTNPPVIQAWEEVLTDGYVYIPDNAVSPLDRGVRIVKTGGECIEPFKPLRFGVTLDEPAKCKIDPLRKRSFDEMDFFFSGTHGLSNYSHSEIISIPSIGAFGAENTTLGSNGELEFHVRCQDPDGNANTATFMFKFCVDEGPDTTPPLITTTSILNNMPIAFNQTSINLQVYVNEPAECKWSKTNQGYENMENQMSCSTEVFEMNAQMLYPCSTILTGLKDRVNNDFYFRCKDQPHLAGTGSEIDRNVNAESYKFTLVGTRPLVIDSVEPNGTIKDSTDVIKVTLEARTSAGYNEGDAICYFSDTGNEDDYIEFFVTGSYEHSQDLYLTEGAYTYYIKCVDLGGNTDTDTTSFTLETDTLAPVVVRAFHEEGSLKIITNEEASCVYDFVDCSYALEDGIAMSSSDDDKSHSTAWDSENNFYIKCEDEFGKRPDPDQCSIIARPFEI